MLETRNWKLETGMGFNAAILISNISFLDSANGVRRG